MSVSLQLEPWRPEQDGELSEDSMRRKLEVFGYYVNVYTYTPGTRFTPHTHAVDKIDGILSGRLQVRMSGRQVVLEAGDLLWVPRGTIHSAEVVGRDPVISIDGVRRRGA